MMFGCSFKHSFETERQFPVILLIAKFWQFSSLRHKVEHVNVSLEKKKNQQLIIRLSIDLFSIAHDYFLLACIRYTVNLKS